MEINSIALLLMVLLNAVICLCLPRVLTLLWPNSTNQSLEFDSKHTAQ